MGGLEPAGQGPDCNAPSTFTPSAFPRSWEIALLVVGALLLVLLLVGLALHLIKR